jgi:uncharacterized protein (DUF1778 family)
MTTSVKVKDEKSKGRTARFEFRATPQQQMLIHLAAQAVNKSVTQFVLDSACAAAENTLLDQRFFILEEEDWQKFQEALERPAQVKPGLLNLMKEKAPWE